MEKREQFSIQTSFPEACQYLQTAFFQKAKQAGIGAWIQLLSPKTTINETHRFAMTKVLEKKMFLTIQIERNADGRTFVTVLSSYRITEFVIVSLLASIPTCGLAILLAGPAIWVKSNRWDSNFQKAVAILKNDLGVIQ